MNPCRSRPAAAWRTSPKQPSASAAPSKAFTAFWVSTGSCSCNMGNASTHDPSTRLIPPELQLLDPVLERGQAGCILLLQITSGDVSQQCPCRSLYALIVFNVVMCAVCVGGRVRRRLRQRGPAQWKRIRQPDCRSGTQLTASHNFDS